MAADIISRLFALTDLFLSGGYWIAFLAAFLDTTLGISLIIPGSFILFLLGILSATGHFDVHTLIGFSVAGTLLSDSLNYYQGKRYGSQRQKPQGRLFKLIDMEQTRLFVKTYGLKGLLFGRVIPGTKEKTAFIAGNSDISKTGFMLCDFSGAIGWVLICLLSGYFFAHSANLAELWLSRAGLFIPFASAFVFFMLVLKWIVIKKGERLLHLAHNILHALKIMAIKNKRMISWAKQHPGLITFISARMDSAVFTGRPLSIFILAFLYVTALFAGIVEDFITSDAITAADIRIAYLFYLFRNDTLTTFFTWITLLGKAEIIAVVVTTSIAILFVWHKKYLIYPFLVSTLGSLSFTWLGKLAFQRARPEFAVYLENSFSFPSGHATIAVAIYGFLGYLFVRSTHDWSHKVNIFFATAVLALLLGFSRVYLGVHYISDIWSGYLVGAMWLIMGVTLSEWLRHTSSARSVRLATSKKRFITVVLVISALLFYGAFASHYHPPLLSPPVKSALVITEDSRIFKTEQLKYTEDLIGRKQEPISFIFRAADNQTLISALQKTGWALIDQADISSFAGSIRSLISKEAYPAAPIYPSFWDARIQDFAFRKLTNANWLKDSHYLKIWHTNYKSPDEKELYVGMVSADKGFKWGIIPVITPDLNAEREQLYQDLLQMNKVSASLKIQIRKSEIGYNFTGDPFFSDGYIYVLSLQ